MMSGLRARPSSLSLRAAMNMVGVLPVPTGYGHRHAGEETIRCTMSALVRVGREPVGHAGEGEVRAVVAAQDHGVEPPVVLGAQPVGAFWVLPCPFGEPGGQGPLLLLGEHGLGLVADPGFAVGGADGVVDDGCLAVDGEFQQPVAVDPAGAPFFGRRRRVRGASFGLTSHWAVTGR